MRSLRPLIRQAYLLAQQKPKNVEIAGDSIAPSALRAIATRLNLLSRRFKTGPVPNKKRAPQGNPSFSLVAGARYENYMQIAIEPFPLVA
jgi:hypothetical protein